MRIIAGKLKGSILLFPKNKNTRPLKDRARESIFNLLNHSNKILFKFQNSNILDLYAGTGSFGLECLSRGAGRVCFVEKEKKIKQILEKNINKLKLKKNANIYFNDVFSIFKKKNIFNLKFDLIFCDPPFKDSNMEKLILLICNNDVIKKDTVLILHRHTNVKEELPSYFNILDEKIYGISKIIFGKILL